MEIEDDRTETEKKSHYVLIGGTDRFMSGWGKAYGGKSYAFWACRPDDERKVMEWIERRGDIQRIRTVFSDYRPKGKGHCHIYVVHKNHPSVKRKYELLKA